MGRGSEVEFGEGDAVGGAEAVAVHGEADVVVAEGGAASVEENEGTTTAVIFAEFPGGAGEGVGLGGREAVEGGAGVAVVVGMADILLEKKEEGLAVWDVEGWLPDLARCEGRKGLACQRECQGRHGG